MAAHGDGAKTIWGTEIGWGTGTGSKAVSESQQAAMVAEMISAWSRSPFAGNLFWYNWQDLGSDRSNVFDNMGVLRSDGSAKPALGGFSALLHGGVAARPVRPDVGLRGSSAPTRGSSPPAATAVPARGGLPLNRPITGSARTRAGVGSGWSAATAATAGAAVDWFARIGALPPAAELDALLREGDDDPTVVCVPALQGTGVPSWNAQAAGTVLGLRLGTTRAQLARAVVDGVLHQVVDGLDAIGGVRTLGLDGGLARSPWIAQRLADLSGVRVERAARPDSTALGAALLAGLAAGVWTEEPAPPAPDLVADPAMADRAERRARWAAARRLTEDASAR